MLRDPLKIYIDNGLGADNPPFKGIDLVDWKLDKPRMGTPKLTATLMHPECLDKQWTDKEYVGIDGEKYYVVQKGSSSKGNGDARYKHDLTFISERDILLGGVYFYDTVYFRNTSLSASADKPVSNSTKFTFYGTVREFADRINCSLRYRGIGDSILETKTTLTTLDTPVGDGYCVMLDPYGSYDPDKAYEFSFEDKYIADAIAEGFNKTKIPFAYRGKKIVIGELPTVVEHKFEYGADNELLSVSKKNANAKVINSITMLGSTENIPHYYPNETEYGHISLTAKAGNSVLATSMLSIGNMTTLLSRINADQYAVLGKYSGETSSDAGTAAPTAYEYSFGGEFSAYTLNTPLQHQSAGTAVNADWKIRIKLNVTKAGIIRCTEITGAIWQTNTAHPTSYGQNMMSAVIHATIRNVNGNAMSVSKDEDGLLLGHLATGNYILEVWLPIPNRDASGQYPVTAYCNLMSVKMSVPPSEHVKTGYYWKVGDKKYDGIGALGVKLDGTITDAMIGDGFGWTASGRMPFQTNLMPPKYRQTLGVERFYNALNNTYTDPDTNQKYVFPNPYVAGRPSEYIHKDETIKPTIEGVENASGQLFGVIAGIAYDEDDNDALKVESTSDGDKNDTLKYEHSFFYIKLNIFDGDYGFDLFKSASQTDAMTLQMTDGPCNGCKFKIQAAKMTDETGLEYYANPIVVKNGTATGVLSEDGIKESDLDPTQQNTQTHSIWICVQKDASTFGVIMPNKSHGYLPKVGDKFNIINIDLPQGYITAAEKRLEEEGIRFMADNNEDKFTFDITASRIFFAENSDVLAQLDEYSKIIVKYNGTEYEQYVGALSIEMKEGDVLPNIGISLVDTIAVGETFVQNVVDRALSMVANPTTTGGYRATGGGMTAEIADRRYVNKMKADRTPYKLASDIGFEIGEFLSGSQGGIFHVDPETGQTYLEVDKAKFRMKAIFNEIEVAKLSSVRGEVIITPGGSVDITYVEELDDVYRCYFTAKDEERGGDCNFKAGDFGRCQEFNISEGISQDASNQYYWRKIVAVSNDGAYFDLSKTDCDTGSGVPQVGDTVCQLGSDIAGRQSAIMFSTVNDNAPSVTLYHGINTYSLVDKAVIEYGVDKTDGKVEPFFNCYGRFFFGPKTKESYLKFEPSENTLVFKGKLSVESSVGDKSLDQYIKDVVPPVTQEDIEGYVNAIVNPKFEGIQNQIDGAIETFFAEGVPTLTNYPASGWTDKDVHLGDLYYDRLTGIGYRFGKDEQGVYSWDILKDTDVAKALADAAKAQDTADGKRRVFTAQPTTQQVYDVGDLWVNATYGTQYSDDILRCVTHKDAGVAFSITHWTLASKYTDDTALNTFIQRYETEIKGYKDQLDGKVETWYYAYDPTASNEPASDWNATEKTEHAGDLFFNTVTKKVFRWTGTAWESMTDPDIQNALDAASDAQDTADNKRRVFMTTPTTPYDEGDLWIDTTADGKTLKVCTAARATGAFASGDWVIADDASLNVFATTIETSLNGIRDQIDQKAETWYQPTDPSTAWTTAADKAKHKGDLWYCTADIAETDYKKGTTWYWNGAAWEKQDVPESVFDAIDGKADIFVSKPTTGYHKNDLWFLEADYTLSGVAYKAGTLVVAKNNMGAEWSADDWIKKDRYTDATDIANALKDYEYLTEALKDVTTIQGALMMTGLVRLGQYNSDITQQVVWAGINGVRTNDKSIAAWYGGDMLDKENGGTGRTAKSLFRMDGSGYLADGNITWNAAGAMTFGSGIGIDLGGGNTDTLGGLSNTLANNINLLNNVLNCFEPQDSGNNPVGWDSPNIDRIKVKKNFYSMGFVSARGMNPDGTIAPLVTSLDALTDVTLTGLAAGQALVYNGSEWVNQTIQAGGIDEATLEAYLTDNNYITSAALNGYATQSWVNTQGFLKSVSWGAVADKPTWIGASKPSYAFSEITGKPTTLAGYGITDAKIANGVITLGGNTITPLTSHQSLANYATASALSTGLAGKVSKTGDTMSGALLMTSAATAPDLTTQTALSYGRLQCWGTLNINGNTDNSSNEYVNITAGHGLSSSTADGLSIGTSTLTWQNNKVWHSGNDGSGSGLDADLWDGEQLSNFRMRKVYSLNLGSLSTSNFYPVTFGGGVWEMDCEIHSPSRGGSEAYNQNHIHFILTAYGWTDTVARLLILSQGNYDNGEITIGAIGTGNRNGERCVWLRGGMNYTVIANAVPTLRTADYSYGDEKYTVGTSLYGGTNANVTIRWQNTDTLRDNAKAATLQSNVASATKLATARSINGTSFDGTANITTASWGTARNIYIADATAAHTGAAVSVNGGGNATLKLPATITAALSGNASTATTLQTTRTLWGQSFNGSGNVSGNISGCTRILNANNANLYLGNSDNSGWVLTQDICSHSAAGDTYWSLRTNGTFHCVKAQINTTTNSYALNAASFICDSWVRTTGATGWYNETYGGGWYMEDSDWLRAWNSKGIYTAGQIYSRSSVRIGDCTMVWDGANTINIQDKNLMGRNLGINDTSGVGVGISLYGGAGHVGDYGIMFATTANYGKHLNVYGDWATYFTMYGDNRGWIFKKANNNTNVASISAEGWFSCRKGLQICGPTTNNMAYNTDNPRVIFCEEDPNASDGIAQRVGIVYTDYDSYRRGKGLCVMDIDRDDPTVWFEVKGTIFATTGIESAGYITAKTANSSSDARLKDILGNILLDIDTMADAPSVRFKWKDTGEIAAGSIAQYWQPRIPEVVSTNNKGYYTLGYGVLGTLMGKSCAVHLRRHEHILLTHESRITRLERENREMRQEINELKRQLLNND